MKVRNGFVSNSSSTSFCIYGTQMDVSKVREYLRKPDLFTEINSEEIEDDYTLLDVICNKNSKVLDYITDNSGNVYLGRSYFTLKDTETGGEFKKATKEEFKRLFEKEFNLEMIMDYVSD